MTPLRIDLRDIREWEKAAKAEVLRRFGARGTRLIPGSLGLRGNSAVWQS
jgi:hypothetical protein